jgi:hypothetical protein
VEDEGGGRRGGRSEIFTVELVAEGVLEWKYGLRLRESYVSLES